MFFIVQVSDFFCLHTLAIIFDIVLVKELTKDIAIKLVFFCGLSYIW